MTRSVNTSSVRIFTPAAELPFAGHPTLGTAAVIAETQARPEDAAETMLVLEEGVGPVPVSVRLAADGPAFALLTVTTPPEYRPAPPPPADLAAMPSLEAADVAATPPPAAVSCGLPFLFVRLASLDAVRRCRLRTDVWERALANQWAADVCVFSQETDAADADVHARVFVPGAGIAEDPATGSAAAAMAAHLARHTGTGDGRHGWTIEQGCEMGRPSRLFCEAEVAGGAVAAIHVGGHVVAISRGHMRVPAPV